MSCQGLFITGTDTGVGKTHVACLVLRALKSSGLRIAAYKPVCSGALDRPQNPPTWDDLLRLQAAVGGSTTVDQLCRQRFLAPLAPPLAARLEQRQVDPLAIDAGLADCCTRADAVIVEGAGGWLCPLTETETLA
ncbi:MAG: dethiobiotin synthase, partial [Planctomycetales bacterium 12-60-4]